METLIKNWRTVLVGVLFLAIRIVGLYTPLEAYAIIPDILVGVGFLLSADAETLKSAIKRQ
jgi:hypothetical protein